ncbi:MAG: PilZ domain-containing protein [Deltaproteobacteria bacterium]|nr:PilZ domain-containing protein [Deltaproteobacteria bacterium]
MGEHSQKEQRVHERFRVKDGVFAVIRKNNDTKLTVGQIIDISKGGMSFKYLANSEPIDGVHKLDIYSSGNGAQLKDITFRVVTDFRIDSPFPFSTVFMRRGGLQFQDLSDDHLNRFSEFIGKFTDIESLN